MSRFVVFSAILAAAAQALPFGWCCRFDLRLSCCTAAAPGADCGPGGPCCNHAKTTPGPCGDSCGATCGDSCDAAPVDSGEPERPADPCGPKQFCCCVEAPATTPKYAAPPAPDAIATPVVLQLPAPAFRHLHSQAPVRIAGRTLCQVLCRYRC